MSRPSERKAKRKRDKVLKTAAIVTSAMGVAGSVAGGAIAYGKKKKKSKTVDELADVKAVEEETE